MRKLRNRCNEYKLRSCNFCNELQTFWKINAIYNKCEKLSFSKITLNALSQLFLCIWYLITCAIHIQITKHQILWPPHVLWTESCPHPLSCSDLFCDSLQDLIAFSLRECVWDEARAKPISAERHKLGDAVLRTWLQHSQSLDSYRRRWWRHQCSLQEQPLWSTRCGRQPRFPEAVQVSRFQF